MPELLAEICPRCGSQLILRETKHGHEFIGCSDFPACRFTRQWEKGEELKLFIPPPVYCGKCSHTGWLPFIKPDGTISAYAQIPCQCRKDRESHEHYPPLRAEAIDFPCSYSWRSFYEEQATGNPGPALEERSPSLEPEQVVVHRHSDMSAQDWDLLQQTARRAEYLERKLNELLKRKKPKKYERYT